MECGPVFSIRRGPLNLWNIREETAVCSDGSQSEEEQEHGLLPQSAALEPQRRSGSELLYHICKG